MELKKLACIGVLALGLVGCKEKKQYIINRSNLNKSYIPGSFMVWSPAKAEDENTMLKTYWTLINEKDLRKMGFNPDKRIKYISND